MPLVTPMPRATLAALLFLLLLLAAPLAAARAAIVDPAGDFLATYVGPRNPDLDVLRADAIFDGTSFTLSSLEAGPIGTTPGALFVWGFDRGQGTPRFLDIGITGVVFDAVAVLNPTAGTVAVNDLLTGASTTLPGGALQVSGSSLSATVPASLLPSRGLAPQDYTVNLWPRTAVGPGTNNLIADFAPDNSNFRVTPTAAAVPEPASAALVLTGLAGLLALRRPRR